MPRVSSYVTTPLFNNIVKGCSWVFQKDRITYLLHSPQILLGIPFIFQAGQLPYKPGVLPFCGMNLQHFSRSCFRVLWFWDLQHFSFTFVLLLCKFSLLLRFRGCSNFLVFQRFSVAYVLSVCMFLFWHQSCVYSACPLCVLALLANICLPQMQRRQ